MKFATLVQVLASWGFPFSQSDLCYLVREYLNKKGVVNLRFKDNLPSHRWVDTFLGRHKHLTLRTANPIKRNRAKVSREEVTKFIQNWEETIQDVPPQNIFNYDETNLR